MNKEEIYGLHTQMVSDEIQLKLLGCQTQVYPSKLTELDREYLCALQNIHMVLSHAVLAIHVLSLVSGYDEKFSVLKELHNDDKRLDVIDQCLLAIKCS